jgi:hypothetical protein
MGFFSNRREVREGRKAAMGAFEELQQQALGGMDAAGIAKLGMEAQSASGTMIAYRDRLHRLATTGVDGSGTVKSVTPIEIAAMLGGEQVRIELTVQPAGGTPYDAFCDQVLMAVTSATLAPGTEVMLKIDPADPSAVMFWAVTGRPAGAAGGGQPAGGEGDRVAKLEKLAQLHASGALSDAEFADAKNRLLG